MTAPGSAATIHTRRGMGAEDYCTCDGPWPCPEARPTSAACVCGHAPAHHTKRDSVYAGLMADYRVVWRCRWKGCGCPEYVEVKP